MKTNKCGWNLTFVLLLTAGIALLLVVNVALGSVSIPAREVVHILAQWAAGHDDGSVWTNIVLRTRIPQALTALLCGAGLAVAGLEMQTVFRNPLAGPSVLGISNGASLGVALLLLFSGQTAGLSLSTLGIYGGMAVTLAAALGAMGVMTIIATVARHVRGNVTLLIMGVMIGYIVNAIIGVLKYFSVAEDIHSYTIWGLGSFSAVGTDRLPLFAIATGVLLPLAFLMAKPLNLMLLGEHYAQNLGLDVRRMRTLAILSASLLVAVCTAFCGPISFLGLAVPHLCRGLFRTTDHRWLMPACMLAGAALALCCNLLARLPGAEGALPVNSVTALIGAPVVIWVLFHRR